MNLQSYTGYLRSRFSIEASLQVEQKIMGFIAAHKLPKSYYYELRVREMDKRLIQTRTLEETLKKMTQQRSLIDEWNLTAHLKHIVKTLKIYTKSSDSVIYVVNNKKSHLFVVIYYSNGNGITPLGEHFKIKDRSCISTYAADRKEIILTSCLNYDKRFPLATGWYHAIADVAMAAPVMNSCEHVLAVIQLTKAIHSTEYSFLDIEAVSILTSLCGYLAEENETASQMQMSLTFINLMMKLITQYLESTLPVAGILSQLTLMNKNELCAEKCSFSVMRYIRDRKFNITYVEDPENTHCHIEKNMDSSQIDESFLGEIMRTGETKKKKQKLDQRWLFGIPIKFNEVTGGMQFQFIANREPDISEMNANLLETTCTFLGFILELNELSDTLFKQEREIILIEDMLKLQNCRCTHDLERLQSNYNMYKVPDDIFTYSWSPEICISQDTEILLLRSFVDYRIGHLFRDDMTLHKFVLFIKMMHLHDKDIFYRHIVITIHFIIVFLKHNEDYFLSSEKDALILSAVLHRILQCKPSYSYVYSAIFKMYKINDHLPKVYVDAIVEKAKRWNYLFPCNYISSESYGTQKKYHQLLNHFQNKTFNNQNKSHRELIILAVIINADKSMYYKNKIFMSHHDEFSYAWGIGFTLPVEECRKDLAESRIWVPKNLDAHDINEYQRKKRLAVNLIKFFIQPWLNILKVVFQDTEYLQSYLDLSVKQLKEDEKEVKEETRKTFIFVETTRTSDNDI